MNPFRAIVKPMSAASAAALLSLGVAGVIAQAASPATTPTTAATKHSPNDARADRRAIHKAVFEAEADTLKLTPDQLLQALKDGKKVSDLANDRGMNKDQFAKALATNLKPRLKTLVDNHVITQAQADKALDRIAKGHIPFWNGIHHKKTK
jgi:DNA-binding phage protein